MAAKDFGIYTNAASGLVISSTGRKQKWDTDTQEDSAFSHDTAAGEVTLNDTRAYLVIFGSGFVQDGTGVCNIRMALQNNASNVPGGVAYGNFTDVDGVDSCDILGFAVVDATAGDKLRVITKAVVGDATEQANKGHIQIIALPGAFEVVIRTDNADRTITGAYADKTWNVSERIDTGYTLSGSSAIVVDASGQYLAICSMVFDNDGNLTTTAEGARPKVRMQVNGSGVRGSGARCVLLHENPQDGNASLITAIPLPLNASDSVKVQVGFDAQIDALDTVQTISSGSVFALIRIDDLTRTADSFEVYTATTTAPTTKVEVDWSSEDYVDSDFTHSTVTNPSRVAVPAGKFLSFACLSMKRSSSGNANDMAWHTNFKRALSVDIDYGDGGSSTNLGYNSSQLQDGSDVSMALICDEVAGFDLEVSMEKIGTSTDSTAQFIGGTAAISSVWWGVLVEKWPDDGQTVAPAILGSAADFAGPSFSLGAISILPSIAASASAPQTPNLFVGTPAAKDLGIYLQSAAGAVADATERNQKWNTSVENDPSFGHDAATGEITLNGTRDYLVIWGSTYEQDGTGYCNVRSELQINGVRVPGGRVYGHFSDVDAVDTVDLLGFCIVRATAEDKLRVRIKAVKGDALEVADRGHIQLLALPDTFVMAQKSSSADIAATTTYADRDWNVSDVLDTGYTLIASDEVRVDSGGYYIAISNTCFSNDGELATVAEGCVPNSQLMVNGVFVPGGGSRCVLLPLNGEEGDANILTVVPLSLDALDVVKVQVQFETQIDANDVVESIGIGSGFALLRVDNKERSTASAFEIYRFASSAPSTIIDVEWDQSRYVDSDFTHSTSTNPERVLVPIGKILTFATLGMKHAISPVASSDDSSWQTTWRTSGGLTLDYGGGGSGTNLGMESSELQDGSNCQMGLIRDNPSAFNLVTSMASTGTSINNMPAITGGPVAIASIWWGIFIEDWPGDSSAISVLPVVIGSAGDFAAPSASMGSLPITPSIASSASSQQPPSITLGALSLSIATAASAGDVLAASLALGALAVTPSLVASGGSFVLPSLALGSLTVAPQVAASSGTAALPSITLGALILVPGIAAATGQMLPVTLTIGGSGIVVAPLPIAAASAMLGFDVSLGTLSIGPGGIIATASVISPIIGMGTMSVLPGVIVASSYATSPTILTIFAVIPAVISSASDALPPSLAMGGIMVMPDATMGASDAVGPSIILGTLTALPGLISATSGILDPTLSLVLTVQPSPVASAGDMLPPTVAMGILTVGPVVISATGDVLPIQIILPGQGDFYTTVSRAVRARWKVAVETPLSLVTHYENMPAKKVDALYAFFAIVFDEAGVLDAGGDVRIEQQGHLAITLRAPAYLGSGAVNAAAESIRTAFQDMTVSEVRYKVPKMIRTTQSAVRYELEMICPFVAENTAPQVETLQVPQSLDFVSVAKIIRDIWINEVSIPLSLPTQFDALKFDKPDDGPWARLKILPGGSFTTNGATIRTPGLVVVQVLTPAETGDKQGIEIHDAVNRVFRHRDAEGLIFDIPSPGAARRDGAWFIRNIQIPWSADSAA